MKKLILIITCLAMSGCAVSSLESQKPIFTAHSLKTADALNRCVAPKWIELRSTSSSIPTESGYKIIASDDIFGALSVVKINESANGGSDIEVFAVARGFNDHWEKAASSCI